MPFDLMKSDTQTKIWVKRIFTPVIYNSSLLGNDYVNTEFIFGCGIK